mmetsp:Transcript_10717/g.66054  ORF Transcript_10717/g.66054 Transcript_10717/m.66054 type:complete len:267 (+) Transcript_10717:1382-2182(+)
MDTKPNSSTDSYAARISSTANASFNRFRGYRTGSGVDTRIQSCFASALFPPCVAHAAAPAPNAARRRTRSMPTRLGPRHTWMDAPARGSCGSPPPETQDRHPRQVTKAACVLLPSLSPSVDGSPIQAIWTGSCSPRKGSQSTSAGCRTRPECQVRWKQVRDQLHQLRFLDAGQEIDRPTDRLPARGPKRKAQSLHGFEPILVRLQSAGHAADHGSNRLLDVLRREITRADPLHATLHQANHLLHLLRMGGRSDGQKPVLENIRVSL